MYARPPRCFSTPPRRTPSSHHALCVFCGVVSGQAERYVVLLSEVPNVRARIDGFVTHEKFPGRFADLSNRVDIVRKACRDVGDRLPGHRVLSRSLVSCMWRVACCCSCCCCRVQVRENLRIPSLLAALCEFGRRFLAESFKGMTLDSVYRLAQVWPQACDRHLHRIVARHCVAERCRPVPPRLHASRLRCRRRAASTTSARQ